MRPKNKDQGLRKGLKPKMPLHVVCEWEDCQAEFDNMSDYSAHVTNHLHTTLGKPSQETAEPKDEEEEDEYNCLWRHCPHDTGRGFIELVRHVYFHAFQTKLKSYGRTIIEWNQLEECGLDAGSCNLIPELPDRLQCGWRNCDLVSDNCDYFYQHVAMHVCIYGDGNFPEGGAPCLWEGCETVVKSKYKLREHLRSHTQEKLIACPTCGGLFANTTKMFDHLQRQIQSTVQTYQCSHCNKRCPTERLLRDHMRHHVNHYKCPLCDMTCPNPSGLRAHIKYRHTEEKPYDCDQCDYKGKALSDLRRHVLVHSSSKDFFQCHVEDCNYETKTYFSLMLHFKQDHQGLSHTTYQCHLCLRTFTRGTNLTSHLKKWHKFKWPSGHRRFRYKMHEDGIYRLQTIRYESIELTQQLLKDKIHLQGEGSESAPGPADEDTSPDSSHIRTSTPEPSTNPDSSGSIHEADFSYNLEMLGEVALQLPKGRFARHMEALRHDNKENEGDGDSETGGENDCSEMELESNGETSAMYSESEYAQSEYTQSEYAQSEYAQSEFGHSEYAASDSHYMGSERYAESEPDCEFPSVQEMRQGPSATGIDSRETFGLPMDLTSTSSDMPPMLGPQAHSVGVTSFENTIMPTQTSSGGHTPHDIQQLQPLPTSIEETTQLLSS